MIRKGSRERDMVRRGRAEERRRSRGAHFSSVNLLVDHLSPHHQPSLLWVEGHKTRGSGVFDLPSGYCC